MIVIKLFVVTCSDGYNTLSSSAVEIYSSLSSTLSPSLSLAKTPLHMFSSSLLLDTPPTILYLPTLEKSIEVRLCMKLLQCQMMKMNKSLFCLLSEQRFLGC